MQASHVEFGSLPDLPSDDDVDDYDWTEQTDEELLLHMMEDEDLSDSDQEEQTREELLAEMVEEHGTMTSPDRCACCYWLQIEDLPAFI